MNKIFVYGTLMAGYGNNRIIQEGSLITRATLKGLGMWDYGFFPVVSSKANSEVVGEVWEIDDDQLQHCDWLEGHPTFYHRVEWPCEDIETTVQVYIQDRNQVENLPFIPSGDWRQYG